MKTLEERVIEMSYVDAFLLLTMDHNIRSDIAMEWLHMLSNKHPSSRLSAHAKYLTQVTIQ